MSEKNMVSDHDRQCRLQSWLMEYEKGKYELPCGKGHITACQEVNAKSLSTIFVRQIGHSEQASEQDLHTAVSESQKLESGSKMLELCEGRRFKKTYNKNVDMEVELLQLAIRNRLYTCGNSYLHFLST